MNFILLYTVKGNIYEINDDIQMMLIKINISIKVMFVAEFYEKLSIFKFHKQLLTCL